MLLTGDLGFTVFEDFRSRFPRQFLNCGVAEQNMIAVAAGLAMSGHRVFVYSIIPFVTFRCLEHIRNDLCHHGLPVCVVGVGAGYSYGHLGSSHHALEDIAVMRAMPGMTVVSPGDPWEVSSAVEAIARLRGPSYLRLGKNGEPPVHPSPPLEPFVLGKILRICDGNDLTIVATGSLLATAMKVAEFLSDAHRSVRVLSMHTLKPVDCDSIRSAVEGTRLVVTLEEHGPVGGLASIVMEALSLAKKSVPILPLTTPEADHSVVGSQQYLRGVAHLLPEQIAERILCALPD